MLVKPGTAAVLTRKIWLSKGSIGSSVLGREGEVVRLNGELCKAFGAPWPEKVSRVVSRALERTRLLPPVFSTLKNPVTAPERLSVTLVSGPPKFHCASWKLAGVEAVAK